MFLRSSEYETIGARYEPESVYCHGKTSGGGNGNARISESSDNCYASVAMEDSTAAAFRFLVVDDNADSRQLLVKTLARKYPHAIFHECKQGDPAMGFAKRADLSAIVAHRTFDYDGETLVALFRRVNPTVPIIMVSGYDRSARAIAAGADAFLNYDQWLMISNVVAKAMADKRDSASTPPFKVQEPSGDALASEAT
jgi:CheY-like chemotaxis protein